MKFDSTVNLGHIITLMTIMAAGFIAFTDIKVELAQLSITVENFQGDLERLEKRIERLEAKR